MKKYILKGFVLACMIGVLTTCASSHDTRTDKKEIKHLHVTPVLPK